MNAAKIGRCHSGGPERLIQFDAVETLHPRCRLNRVGPRSKHCCQVIPEDKPGIKILNEENKCCAQLLNEYNEGMSEAIKQYRVIFKSTEIRNGNFVESESSTRWYDSIEETEKWMSEDSVRIITREFVPSAPTPPAFQKA